VAYTHLNWQKLSDTRMQEIFRHADEYLHDAYGMFKGLPPAGGDGGGGNFSIVLVLLCVIDGLAREVWPTNAVEKDQGKRFKQLLRTKIHWGPEGRGKWFGKGIAADQLYTEFRNPLVHELAMERSRATSRPKGYIEPVVGKWGSLPEQLRDIAQIDDLEKWDDAWPVLAESKDEQGNLRLKLTAAALYWAVKQLAVKMLHDIRIGKSRKSESEKSGSE